MLIDRFGWIVFDMEATALRERAFRREIYTDPRMQITIMSIPPGTSIGKETHSITTQFLRIEAGTALVTLKGHPSVVVRDGWSVVIPAGTEHDVKNLSTKTSLQLYSIYTPPNHPKHTVDATRKASDTREAKEDVKGNKETAVYFVAAGEIRDGTVAMDRRGVAHVLREGATPDILSVRDIVRNRSIPLRRSDATFVPLDDTTFADVLTANLSDRPRLLARF